MLNICLLIESCQHVACGADLGADAYAEPMECCGETDNAEINDLCSGEGARIIVCSHVKIMGGQNREPLRIEIRRKFSGATRLARRGARGCGDS